MPDGILDSFRGEEIDLLEFHGFPPDLTYRRLGPGVAHFSVGELQFRAGSGDFKEDRR